MVLGGSVWFFVVLGCSWGFFEVLDWFLVVLCGSLWFFVVLCGDWYFFVGSWLLLAVLGGFW